jgi:predicted TIM-barrel fold metal-dependent hydrolase
MNVTRRQFLETMAAVTAASTLSPHASAQPKSDAPNWGSPVIDCHFHFRKDLPANVAHLDGSGTTQAFVLTRVTDIDQLKQLQAKYPGRFPGWAASVDITQPDTEDLLTKAVDDGATCVGEIKTHEFADSGYMRRAFAVCRELKVPILIHFQEVPHTPTEGIFNSGFAHFDRVLRAYPTVNVVGHCDAFWANVSDGYANDVDYPTGPIKRGGITDKWLSDYPNLYGDLSANSGNNALTRDPSFTADFLSRHKDKLHFGSDCSCTDGRGGGISQNGNPGAARLAGKCVARETLTVLKANTTPEAFHQLAWSNAHRLYNIPSQGAPAVA